MTTLDTFTLGKVYQMLPNQRTITHTAKNPSGATQTIPGCTRRPWNKLEIAQYGSVYIEPEKSSFLIPTANIGGSTPKNGDQLTDDESIAWLILATNRELESAMLRATCIKATV